MPKFYFDEDSTRANVGDFSTLHREWALKGRHHAGILVIQQQRYSTGEIVRRMLRVKSARRDLRNGIHYLSNF